MGMFYRHMGELPHKRHVQFRKKMDRFIVNR